MRSLYLHSVFVHGSFHNIVKEQFLYLIALTIHIRDSGLAISYDCLPLFTSVSCTNFLYRVYTVAV